MSEIPEWIPQRGRYAPRSRPGTKKIGLTNGTYFKETGRCHCIDRCVIKRCTCIVYFTEYREHEKRKRLNIAKRGKTCVEPGKQHVL
jgi:hypothetical protein